MPTRFSGPLKNAELTRGSREWYSNLNATSDPDLVEYYNDFLFAQDYAATDWVVTETDAAATEAIAADEVGGALLVTNTAADDDIVQLQSAEEWLKLSAGKRLWFETRLKISDATQSDLFVGLATTDTTIIAGTTDSCGFRKSDGAATLVSITEDATVETTNTAATLVSATYVKLGFYWDGVSTVKFFVNRALTASHTANIEQTNKLALTFTLQNGEGVAKTLTIDYVYVAMER
jgi:hypothetical protein